MIEHTRVMQTVRHRLKNKGPFGREKSRQDTRRNRTLLIKQETLENSRENIKRQENIGKKKQGEKLRHKHRNEQ